MIHNTPFPKERQRKREPTNEGHAPPKSLPLPTYIPRCDCDCDCIRYCTLRELNGLKASGHSISR